MFSVMAGIQTGSVMPFQTFNFVSWFVPLIFIIIIAAMLFTIIKNVSEWLSNNKKPVETEKAKMITKRENVRRAAGRRRGLAGSQTAYFATFELENGERKEFKLKGKEYAMLAEGDTGHLTFQGTRYHSFERAENV